MAIREGKWKCPSCAGVNRGRDVNCSACGQARGNVEFFLEDDDAPEVTDAAGLERAQAGADWACAFCSGSNKAGDEKCGSCGAPREEGKARAAGDVVGLGHRSASEERKAKAAAAAPAGAGPSGAATAAKGAGVVGCLVLVGLLGLCVIGGLLLRARKTEATLSVASVHWKRTLEVQRFGPVQRSDWSVPPGGRVLRQSSEVKSYREEQAGTRSVEKTRKVQSGTTKVRVGKRDKGNGFFEDVYEDRPVYKTETYTEQEPVYRKVPVYATKYTYEVDDWSRETELVKEGSDLSPASPTLTEAPAGPSGKVREGARQELYEVTLATREGARYVYRAQGEAEFKRFAPGSSWVGLVSSKGDVSELKPASELPAEKGDRGR